MTLKIDVFNHIFPKPFFDRLQDVVVNKGAVKRWLNIPFLYDLDVRFRKLEEFGPEYRQILSLSAPPIESINPDRGITLDLFFGADQVVFASDAPFDPEGGSLYIRETLKVIDSLELSDAGRQKIY